MNDLRFALRSLARRPVFTATAVTTLALGIGGTTALFSVVDGVLVRELPYRDPAELVSVWRAWPRWKDDEMLAYVWNHIHFEVEAYLEMRERSRTLEDLQASVHRRWAMRGDGRTDEISVGLGTAGLFPMLGVHPVLGRSFRPEEALPAAEGARIVLLSHQFWDARFGADPDVLGRTVTLRGEPYEIVGVLPERFRLPSDLVSLHDNGGAPDAGLRDVWVPLGRDGGQCGNCLELIARLAPGRSLEEARADVQPLLGRGPSDQIPLVVPRKELLTREASVPLLLLLGAAGILLLIASLNVAGLLVGDAAGREREVAVRQALGAPRARVARQLLTESALLGLLGSGAGLLLAWIGTDALLALAPPMPRLEEVGVSARVAAFAVLVGVGAGLLFGLAPTAGLLRPHFGGLRTRAHGSGAGRLHAVVVGAQVALTVTLAVAGGLFGRSLARVMSVDPGFRPEGLATLSFAVPADRAATRDGTQSFQAEVIGTLRALPGVRAVSAANELPFPGGNYNNTVTLQQAAGPLQLAVWNRSVLPDYLGTMGVPLLRGRMLSEADRAGAQPVVVVSRSLADRAWPGESPLGKTIDEGGPKGTWTVVGVVGDVRHKTLGAPVQPTFYRPVAQRGTARLYLVVRTERDPAAIIPKLERAIWALDPTTPITDAGVMSALVRDSEADDRFRALLVWTFAALATALASVGIFGVTARAVASRTREIGVRAALGATREGLVRLVVRDGLTASAAGTAVGIACAWGFAGTLGPLLYGTDPHDPATYAAVVALALGVCAVSAWLPGRRATRIEPREAMSPE